ncbi:hypothetical protein NDU88_007579 [Pleurodeles waltl]|uniref:Uncharacterized protein n=1 Tax=Pleurodeles waltl TaxID=8319 RepID=A0AAV7N6A3_PLEWA|nr:hypothetical protein NDU88_007579 [Pleurodeles waltl]
METLRRIGDLGCTLVAHTAAILEAIKDTKTPLEVQIEAVVGGAVFLREAPRKPADHIRETQGTLKTMVPQVKDLNQRASTMEKELRTPVNKLEDTEGGSHHHDAHLVRVPEKVEGSSLEIYVED